MVVGDVADWADRFISLDERFLERITVVWPTCVALLPGQPTEDSITINLVDLLSKDPVVRRICYWVAYQHEPFGLAADGSKYSKGKIDIAILFDWERDRYLAYECKRLNVVGPNGLASLATLYASEGMMRFITEQYAQDLPLGCILGYVMDGDVASARRRLAIAIPRHVALALQAGPTPIAPVAGIPRFATQHLRAGGGTIELRHALLAYRRGG
ncbi:MAG: hypothetical protein ACREDL_23465 [Bradyrhizobium sp.]